MSKYPGPVAARASRRRPLAAAIAAVFALAAPAAYADTYVTNCYDAGPGSLRAAVGAAIEGDTVDARGLTTASPGCSTSTISLTTGDIVTTRSNLTIQGPGRTALTVIGKYNGNSRIFTHNGFGTLLIRGMTVSKGYLVNAAGVAKGGCIYSKSEVSLEFVGVYHCSATTSSGKAYGGGIYANRSLRLRYSTIGQNTANGGSTGISVGGGVMSMHDFHSYGTSIIGNTATNLTYNAGSAGGVFAAGGLATIRDSTITGNIAASNFGGLEILSASYGFSIINSTISGNSAKGFIGGIYSFRHSGTAINSTIAFNTAGLGSATIAAGWNANGPTGAKLNLESVLIANNTYGSSPVVASDISGNVAITGYYNLVRAPNISLPTGTIVGQCPLLAPLRDNGGPTLTHALLSHSPAIDSGYHSSMSYDQRGSPYRRTSGSRPDIGAYEVDQTDKVFDTDFEGCT